MFPVLGTTVFSNVGTHASQSWNCAFPIRKTASSQRLESTRPKLGTAPVLGITGSETLERMHWNFVTANSQFEEPPVSKDWNQFSQVGTLPSLRRLRRGRPRLQDLWGCEWCKLGLRHLTAAATAPCTAPLPDFATKFATEDLTLWEVRTPIASSYLGNNMVERIWTCLIQFLVVLNKLQQGHVLDGRRLTLQLRNFSTAVGTQSSFAEVCELDVLRPSPKTHKMGQVCRVGKRTLPGSPQLVRGLVHHSCNWTNPPYNWGYNSLSNCGWTTKYSMFAGWSHQIPSSGMF